MLLGIPTGKANDFTFARHSIAPLLDLSMRG